MASPVVEMADDFAKLEDPASGSDCLPVSAESLSIPKPYKLGLIQIPNYYSASTQVFIAGFVNFLSVGMFSSSPRSFRKVNQVLIQ
jgi:hypothetical protein